MAWFLSSPYDLFNKVNIAVRSWIAPQELYRENINNFIEV